MCIGPLALRSHTPFDTPYLPSLHFTSFSPLHFLLSTSLSLKTQISSDTSSAHSANPTAAPRPNTTRTAALKPAVSVPNGLAARRLHNLLDLWD